MARTKSSAINRRRFLTGAGGFSLAITFPAATTAQDNSELPIRIQIPDLAFANQLRTTIAQWISPSPASEFELSFVSPEPASDSLLNDARTGNNWFSGALVPNWLLPDLVRDDFIDIGSPPPASLPKSIAQLRSFGGEWVASDFGYDCALLYFRSDLLSQIGLHPATSWEALIEHASFLMKKPDGGVAVPQNHAQQVGGYFAAMLGSAFGGIANEQRFWFDPATMEPSITSGIHQHALESWQTLARATPARLRTGSTGDLWEAFIAGTVGYLIAPASFLPYAIERGADLTSIGVGMLPGPAGEDDPVQVAGNIIGSAWGGVIMRSATDEAEQRTRLFFDQLAAPDTRALFWANPATGIIPAMDTAENLAVLRANGWPEAAGVAWLHAIASTLSSVIQIPPLRIAETRRYLQSLQDHIVPFLGSPDAESAADVLATAANDWNLINTAIGVETQKDLYIRSLMPPPEWD